MVATLRLRQLQKDVNEAEEAELRRLENGATAGGDGDRPASPQTGGGDSGAAAKCRRKAVLAWSWPAQTRCLVRSGKSPGLCSPKWAVPPRLSCTCEVRPELLLLRERCRHHTERACDAPRLVRVDRAWCTATSSVHKAACHRVLTRAV